MPKYIIIQDQDIKGSRTVTAHVEASDEEKALELFENGDCVIVDTTEDIDVLNIEQTDIEEVIDEKVCK